MWIVASIPFWLLGLFCAVTVVCVYPFRKPKETDGDLALQIFVFLLLTGVFFIVAAKVAS